MQHLYVVPQGSVLIGPLLYLYTTLLCTAISNLAANHYLCANDTQLLLSFSALDSFHNITHHEKTIANVSNWMSSNFLSLNPSKTRTSLKLYRAVLQRNCIIRRSVTKLYIFRRCWSKCSPFSRCKSPLMNVSSLATSTWRLHNYYYYYFIRTQSTTVGNDISIVNEMKCIQQKHTKNRRNAKKRPLIRKLFMVNPDDSKVKQHSTHWSH